MKYLIGAIALLLPTYLIRFDLFGVPTTFLEIFIYIVFVVGLLLMNKNRWQRLKGNFWLPVGLLLLAAIISVVVSPLKLAALGQLKAFFIDPILVLFLAMAYLKKDEAIYIFWGLIGAGQFVTIHALWQKITGQVTVDNRVVGIFGYSPNYTAMFLAPIAIILLGLIVWRFREKITAKLKLTFTNFFVEAILALGFVLSSAALYFTGSRGALLATLGGIALMILILNWRFFAQNIYRKLILAAVILGIIIITGFIFRPNFSLPGNAGGRVTSSNNVRYLIWQTTLELAGKNPIFGVGLANFQNAFFNLTKDRVNYPDHISPLALTPHNLFLMFYLTTGILGLFAFLWLVVSFFRHGFKSNHPFNTLLFCALAVILLQGVVDTPFFKNDLSLLFFLLFSTMFLKETSKEKND